MSSPLEQPDPSASSKAERIIPDAVLQRARDLSDSATANGLPMKFDTGLEYAWALHEAGDLPLLPLEQWDRCLRDLNSTEIFKLAEALDVAMHYDPDETRRYNGAALAVDLQNSLQSLPGADADARTRILAGVLKVDGKLPAAPQLAERYFSAKTDLEREIVADVITSRSRTTSA